MLSVRSVQRFQTERLLSGFIISGFILSGFETFDDYLVKELAVTSSKARSLESF